MAIFHPLVVKNIVKETVTAVAIEFGVPKNLTAAFQFKAGQYLTLKQKINGKEIRRAYSICASPNSGKLKVAIKAIVKGVFSNYAISKLNIGDTIEVSEPEGKFLLEPQSNKNYIAFAAGSGITPILSMVKAVLESESTTSFTLIYGNKSVTDTIFYSELNELKKEYSNRFNLHYIFSRERQEDTLFGRIDKGNTNFFVKNKYVNTFFDAVFLCGPETMIQTVSETLLENNFEENTIHFELFTASVEEKNTNEIKEGTTEITVLIDDEETTFYMSKTDDILAASLRNNIDAPYSCQGGVCSSCLAKVNEGKAMMTKNAILTDGEVAEGFILACQAHPTTSKITIDFDDV